MRYRDAVAFRQALEQRLKARARGDGARLARDRKRVAFDRMLARLAATATDRWLLKGGFALDLRLAERARATKDIDLDWLAAEEELLDALIDATTYEVGDFFQFAIERTAAPEDRLGGSHRFRVDAALAGRPATPLHEAIHATFAGRGTHPAPGRLPAPPEDWRVPFGQLAQTVGVSPELADAHTEAATLIDPILADSIQTGTWEPERRRWRDEA